MSLDDDMNLYCNIKHVLPFNSLPKLIIAILIMDSKIRCLYTVHRSPKGAVNSKWTTFKWVSNILQMGNQKQMYSMCLCDNIYCLNVLMLFTNHAKRWQSGCVRVNKVEGLLDTWVADFVSIVTKRSRTWQYNDNADLGSRPWV